MGVLRAVDRPTYDASVNLQVKEVAEKLGPGNLDDLFNSGDTWEVR